MSGSGKVVKSVKMGYIHVSYINSCAVKGWGSRTVTKGWGEGYEWARGQGVRLGKR